MANGITITLPLGYLAPYSPDDGFDGNVREWLRHLLEAYPGRRAAVREVYEGWRDHGMLATARRLGERVAANIEDRVIKAFSEGSNAPASP